MGNIEIGEYVRTKKGLITKITNIEIEKYEDGTSEIFIETELNSGYLDYTIEDIIKHSKQLIDLVEIGDIVNKLEITSFTEKDKEHKEKIAWHNTFYGKVIYMNYISTIKSWQAHIKAIVF